MERLIFFLSILSCNKHSVENSHNIIVSGHQINGNNPFTHRHQELDQMSNNNSILNNTINNQSIIYNFQRKFNESIIIVQGSFWFVIAKIKEGFIILKNKFFTMNNDDSETIYSEENIDHINEDLEHKTQTQGIFFEDKDAQLYQSMGKMAMPQMVDGLGELFAELEKPNSTMGNSMTQRAITYHHEKDNNHKDNNRKKNVSFKSPHHEEITKSPVIKIKPVEILDNKLTHTDTLQKKIILDNTEYVSSSSEEDNQHSSFQDSSSSDHEPVEEIKEEVNDGKPYKSNKFNEEHNPSPVDQPVESMANNHEEEKNEKFMAHYPVKNKLYSPFKTDVKQAAYKLKKNLSIDCKVNKKKVNGAVEKPKITVESYEIHTLEQPQMPPLNLNHNHLIAARINVVTSYNIYNNSTPGFHPESHGTPNPELTTNHGSHPTPNPAMDIKMDHHMHESSLSSFHSSQYKKDLSLKIPPLNLQDLINDQRLCGIPSPASNKKPLNSYNPWKKQSINYEDGTSQDNILPAAPSLPSRKPIIEEESYRPSSRSSSHEPSASYSQDSSVISPDAITVNKRPHTIVSDDRSRINGTIDQENSFLNL